MAGLANAGASRSIQPRVTIATPEAERPSLLESFNIGRRQQSVDNFNANEVRLADAYEPILETLNAARSREGKAKLNNPGHSFREGVSRFSSEDYGGKFWNAPWKGVTADEQQEIIFKEVSRLRALDPKFLAGIADNSDDFMAAVIEQEKVQRAKDGAKLSKGGSALASFAGAITKGFEDPVNILTLPFGGGAKTLVGTAVRGGLTNAVVEAVSQPKAAENRAVLGEKLTGKEAALNIAGAFVFGAAFDASGKAIADNFGAIASLPKSAQEAAWARIVPHLPEKLRGKMDWPAVDALPDNAVADIAENIIGASNLTEAEKGSINLIRSRAEATASSPFVPGDVGEKAHLQNFASAIQQVLDDNPPAVLKQSSPISNNLRGSTAIGTGTISATPARAALKNRIGVVESGSSNSAKNPRSTATGKYQFIGSTWLGYYKRRFGNGGLTNKEILAKRGNGRLQDILMDDLLDDNARFLSRSGQPETAGNLYLTHFAGQGGAGRLFRADPGATARSVLGDAVVEANPFLAKMSAGDVIDWAHRKMGDGPPSRSLSSDSSDRDIITRDLEDDLARLQAEEADLDQALLQDGVDDISPASRAELDAAVQIEPVRIDAADHASGTPELSLSRGRAPGQGSKPISAEVQAIVPDLQNIVRGQKLSLNKIDALAKKLEATEADVQGALNELVRKGDIFVTKGRFVKDGKDAGGRTKYRRIEARYQRKPQTIGTENIFQFVAARGGLRDNEGHALSTGMNLDRFVPGRGPLIRKTGMSIDELGELMQEAGYLGRGKERPTEADVLSFLREANFDESKSVRFEDQIDDLDRAVSGNDGFDEFASQLGSRTEEAGLTFSLEDERLAFENFDGNFDTAIDRVIEIRLQDAVYDGLLESDKDAYAIFDIEDLDNAAVTNSRQKGSDGQGSDAPNAREGQISDAELRSLEQVSQLQSGRIWDEGGLEEFSDPYGVGASRQIDSIEHDLDAQADFAAPNQEQARTALERQGEGRKQSDKSQKPPGSDGGLFDAPASRELEFQIDLDGEAKTHVQIKDELAAEDDLIKTIRDCL